MKELDELDAASPAEVATDSMLVDACLAGQTEAWQALLSRYQRLIYSIPIQAGLTGPDAAEVFQLVSIKLLRKLSTLRDQTRLTKWLITTTSRESWRLARLRRKAESRTVQGDSDEYDLSQIQSRLPLPEEEQLEIEKQQLVRTAVDSLPEKCKNLISLLFLSADEPSYEEISKKMGMPESSIGPTRARCLQKLKKILSQSI